MNAARVNAAAQAIAAALVPLFGDPLAARADYSREGAHIDRGQTVKIAPGQSGVDLVRASFDSEQACTLTFQGDSAGATISVLMLVGEARLTRTFAVSTSAQSVTLTARAIFVSSSVGTSVRGGQPQTAVNVSAALTPGDSNPLGNLQASWPTLARSAAIAATNSDSPYSGPGTLLGVQGSLSSLGGATALWAFVFDTGSLFVTGVNISNAGTGYTASPVVTFAAGGTGPGLVEPVVASVSMAVDAVQITAGGTGYTSAPAVTFSAPQLAGGVTATGTATIAGGAVTGVTITNAGSGYTASPSVTFTGGGFTTPATATSTLHVLLVNFASNGQGITSAPTVTFSAPVSGVTATGTATISLTQNTTVPIVPPVMLTAIGAFGTSGEIRVSAGFASGLTWVLSTTEMTCSAPAAGATARVDFEVGQ